MFSTKMDIDRICKMNHIMLCYKNKDITNKLKELLQQNHQENTFLEILLKFSFNSWIYEQYNGLGVAKPILWFCKSNIV